MKKIIKRFWGVAFVVILLSTLFVAAVPQASAGVLYFSQADQPNTTQRLQEGLTANNTNIYEFVVGYDNLTIYAATSNGGLKSINGGRTWSHLTSIAIAGTNHVAVAPDDVNYVAFMHQATQNVTLSKDGGMTFHALNQARNGVGNVAANVYDIAISKSAEVAIIGGYATSHVLAVAGQNATGYGAGLFYCLTDLIGTEGGWKDAVSQANADQPFQGQSYAGTLDKFLAIEFSPNFDRDRIAYAISANTSYAYPTSANLTYLHVMSFNNARWNSGVSGFSGYANAGEPLGLTDPNTLATLPVAIGATLTRATIVFDPSYLGLENELRTCYFALSAGASDLGGVWRSVDQTGNPLFTQMGMLTYLPNWAMSSMSINSDGTVIVVAAYASNRVWTLTNLFMSSLCTVTLNNPMKRIGVTTSSDNQTIAYCPTAGSTNVFAAKQSTEGAFSLSVDNGYTFNDISLINTTLINILDQVVAPDGGNRYVVSNDDYFTPGHMSLFYWDGTYWERTFCLSNNNSFVAKASPTNFEILYLANKTTAHVYFTATAGKVNWKDYQSPKANTTLADIEVESDAKLYAATIIDGKGYVSTLTENGRIWSIPTNPTFFSVSASDPLASLTLVSAGNLIAGSSALGRLAYTTDGGATWRCSNIFGFGAMNVYADAVSLANGSTIYVVFSASAGVWSWTVGNPSSAAWPVFPLTLACTPAVSATQLMQGILIYPHTPAGAVYAISSNASLETWLYRAFLPALGFPGFGEWAATNVGANMLFSSEIFTAFAGQVPDVLKASAGNQIWFIDINGVYQVNTYLDRILAYTDALYEAVPAPSSPIDEYLIQVNKETGRAYDVTLVWSVASSATHYQYQVAKDPAFSVIVLAGEAVVAALFAPTAHIIIGPNQVGANITLNYQPGETYYWRVRAVPYQFTGFTWYYHFYSNWSQVYTLMIQPAPPPVPDLLSPANGGTVSTLRPGFSWSAMSGEAPASGITMVYTLELATDSAFSTTSMVYTTTTTVAGLNLPIDLTDGTQYFWRVCTTTSVTGDWSTVANFNVSLAAAPSPPLTITQTSVTITQTNPPATSITATHEATEVSQVYIWVIIVIGAVLVIAIIVLIVRTRRVG